MERCFLFCRIAISTKCHNTIQLTDNVSLPPPISLLIFTPSLAWNTRKTFRINSDTCLNETRRPTDFSLTISPVVRYIIIQTLIVWYCCTNDRQTVKPVVIRKTCRPCSMNTTDFCVPPRLQPRQRKLHWLH